MCLIISAISDVMTAVDDMVVYKYVRLTVVGNFRTPFMNKPVKLGNTYKANFSFGYRGTIVEAGLHSYEEYESAELNSYWMHNKAVIIKCIIPKGANYYKGWYGSKVSYVSDEITYVEIVNN